MKRHVEKRDMNWSLPSVGFFVGGFWLLYVYREKDGQ